MKKKTVIIVGAVIVVGILLAFGGFTILFRVGGSPAMGSSTVCSNLINDWNALMGDQAVSRTTEDLSNQITTVKAQQDYRQDPTCNFMLFRASVMTAGYQEAEQALDQLKEQSSKGSNPSISLVDIINLSEMERILKELKDSLDQPVQSGSDESVSPGAG